MIQTQKLVLLVVVPYNDVHNKLLCLSLALMPSGSRIKLVPEVTTSMINEVETCKPQGEVLKNRNSSRIAERFSLDLGRATSRLARPLVWRAQWNSGVQEGGQG